MNTVSQYFILFINKNIQPTREFQKCDLLIRISEIRFTLTSDNKTTTVLDFNDILYLFHFTHKKITLK